MSRHGFAIVCYANTARALALRGLNRGPAHIAQQAHLGAGNGAGCGIHTMTPDILVDGEELLIFHDGHRACIVFFAYLVRDGVTAQTLVWSKTVLPFVAIDDGIIAQIDDIARITLQVTFAFEPCDEPLVIVETGLALSIVDRGNAHETGLHRHASDDALVQIRQWKDKPRKLILRERVEQEGLILGNVEGLA